MNNLEDEVIAYATPKRWDTIISNTKNSNEIYAALSVNVSDFNTSREAIPAKRNKNAYKNTKLYKKFIAEESKKILSNSASKKNLKDHNEDAIINKSSKEVKEFDIDRENNNLSNTYKNCTLPKIRTNNDLNQTDSQIMSSTNPNSIIINPETNQEDDKKVLISQYESLLHQLASQLDIQIKRNKDLEESIRTQAKKSSTIIESLRIHAEDEISELSFKLDETEKENNDLKLQLKVFRDKYMKKDLMENMNDEEIREKINSDKRRIIQLENELKNALNGSIKNTKLESELREKNEEISMLKNRIKQLNEEITKNKSMISELKDDYSSLLRKKNETDSENKELLAQIRSDEISLHKLLQENDRLNESNKTIEELKNENYMMKQMVVEIEREKNLLGIKLDKSHRKYQTLELELMKSESTIKVQMETITELQRDYEELIMKEKSLISLQDENDSITKRRINKYETTKPIENNDEFKPKEKINNKIREKFKPLDNQQDEIKNKYEEYRKRQKSSMLVELFKWPEENQYNTQHRPNVNRSLNNGRKPLIEVKRMKSPEHEFISRSRKVNNSMVTNKTYTTKKEQIEKLQNNLQLLLSEKTKLQKDYSKFGKQSEKSLMQKKRKEEVEFELDLNEKNIQRIEYKLRELDALS